MNFIFDWCQNFDEEKENNWREDAKILFLEISQRECGFASAKVSIVLNEENRTEIFSHKYAKIGVQFDSKKDVTEQNSKIHLLFSGRIISFPIGFGRSCLQIELISEPDNYQQQLIDFSRENLAAYERINMHSEQKDFINFDDLFFSKDDLINPTIFLESGTKCFYWDMRNGKLSLSDINQGDRNIEIDGNNILDDSIKVSLSREPYKNVNISLSANWIRRTYGLIDLYPMIATQFPAHIISSLTNIKNKLRKLCDFNKNGYNWIKCDVKEIPGRVSSVEIAMNEKSDREFLEKSEIADLQRTPKKAHRKSAKESTEKTAKKLVQPSKLSEKLPDIIAHNPLKIIKLKKFYFRGEMLLNWNREEHRTETIYISVLNGKSEHGREKNIHFKLNPIQLASEHPRWRCFYNYRVGDKILYKEFILECIKNHISSETFDESNFELHWKKLGKIPDALSDESCVSFFKTERGQNAVRYALQCALSLINYSSRYIEINFLVDAEKFLSVTVNDEITLIDKRFCGGKISGKVVKTKLIATSKRKLLKISIACASAEMKKTQTEVVEMINKYMNASQRNFEINQEDNDDFENIVRGIEVINPPEEQERILTHTPLKNISDVQKILKKYATGIRIFLSPLHSVKSKILKLPEMIIS